MKRFILVALLCIATATGTYAQRNISGIYGRFVHAKGAESVNVKGFLCRWASGIAMRDADCDMKDKEDKAAMRMMRNVNNIYVLDVSECTDNIKDEFRNCISRLDDAGYELLMEATDGDDQVKIYVKMHDEDIREFLLYSIGDDPCLVNISGRFRNADIQDLVACATEEKKNR
ncbi:MAG: DUF4252 domain-containing protein [Bacteroidales bacterium]|nr:DUF4252 domain-containing protein [Bacteroidales bacterium]MCI2121369.1 DUF4252 domain-containing protein [Bacteroidales bacterium]MCI2145512.1 DUF4252 domain-containing protein [Bacteroidales bacterium]